MREKAMWLAMSRVVSAAQMLARLVSAVVLLLLETSGIGRRLYSLPRDIPRDRDEVAANPEKFFRLAQRSGAVPIAAKFRGIVLHEPDAASMSDPSKLQRTFLLTIAFALDGAQSTTTLCVKTGRFRGPLVLQLILAARAGGHFSRERAFYEHVAPSLRHASVPRCFHADVLGLLTHTFFLLEGVQGVVCYRESEPFDDGVARAFLAAEAKVHRQWWDETVDVHGQPSLAALESSVFGGLLNGTMPKGSRPLLRAIVEYTHGRRCGQGLMHGDARLGNALFAAGSTGSTGLQAGARAGACDVTLVDWEVAQRGPCLFDVLYFLWLCVDHESEGSVGESAQEAGTSSQADADGAGAHARACGLLSQRDWSLVLHWHEQLRTPQSATHAPLEEQLAVMSLLLAAYMLAVGKLGFANVWKDGNNSADLGAWGRRVQRRVEALGANRGALRLAATALNAEAPIDGGWEAELMKVVEQMEEHRTGRPS